MRIPKSNSAILDTLFRLVISILSKRDNKEHALAYTYGLLVFKAGSNILSVKLSILLFRSEIIGLILFSKMYKNDSLVSSSVYAKCIYLDTWSKYTKTGSLSNLKIVFTNSEAANLTFNIGSLPKLLSI